MRSLAQTIKAAAIAGVMAGLLVAVFHFAVTETLINQAIELEEQLHQVEQATGETLLISRDTQQVGLFLGFLLYGLTWPLLFGVAHHLIQDRFAGKGTPDRAWPLALLTGWSVAILPFLKYPANPPGVGDPATIGYRQLIFLVFIALSVVSTIISLELYRFLNRPGRIGLGKTLKRGIVLATYTAVAGIIYFTMPANPDAIGMPADLVSTFRALSLAGLILFWIAFAAAYAWLVRPARSGRPARSEGHPNRARTAPVPPSTGVLPIAMKERCDASG